MVTLARPPTRSSLKVTNRSFRYAAPCLWNELPTDLHEPRQTQSPALSPITHGSSSSSPSLLSPLASFLARSVFHSELKSANPSLHRPFSFLPDWFHGLSDHLMFFFVLSRFSNALKINALSFHYYFVLVQCASPLYFSNLSCCPISDYINNMEYTVIENLLKYTVSQKNVLSHFCNDFINC